MKTPKVAFIDDGINLAFFPKNQRLESIFIENGVARKEKATTQVSHGTACYHVFNDYVESPYHLTSIRTLEKTTQIGNLKNLLTALSWCIETGIDLINMSIGSQQFYDIPDIYKAVEETIDAGIIIVAACNNNNTLTFPACFPMTIGVRHCNDKRISNNIYFNNQAYDHIEAMVCAEDKVLCVNRWHKKTFCASNSIATAIITARVCRYLSEGTAGIKAIKQRLSATSAQINTDFYFYKQLLFKWKPIDIPIIVINEDRFFNLMSELVSAFVKLDYNAVGLIINGVANIAQHIYKIYDFSVPLKETIELYVNFLQSDIVFINSTNETYGDISTISDVVISKHPSNCTVLNEPYYLSIYDSPINLIEELLSILEN